MIINHSHVSSVPFVPFETDSVLSVHTNAELPFSVSAQSFEPIRGRHFQILERQRSMEQQQPHPNFLLDLMGDPPRELSFEDPLCLLVFESLDSHKILTCCVINVKR